MNPEFPKEVTEKEIDAALRRSRKKVKDVHGEYLYSVVDNDIIETAVRSVFEFSADCGYTMEAFVQACQKVAPDKEKAELQDALEKAAETLEEMAAGMYALGRTTLADAMTIAADASRQTLRKTRPLEPINRRTCPECVRLCKCPDNRHGCEKHRGRTNFL